jgi:hypothetical protein
VLIDAPLVLAGLKPAYRCLMSPGLQDIWFSLSSLLVFQNPLENSPPASDNYESSLTEISASSAIAPMPS